MLVGPREREQQPFTPSLSKGRSAQASTSSARTVLGPSQPFFFAASTAPPGMLCALFVTMPPAIFGWIGEYVEKNYRPEPKKRIKPRSFIHPKDRIGR